MENKNIRHRFKMGNKEEESFLENDDDYENLNKTPPLLTVITIGAWLLVRILNILYVPLFVWRLFQQPVLCPPIDSEILMIPAVGLAEKIRKKQLKSEDVVRTYISRIRQVNPIINAVIEERFEEAIKEAQHVDKLVLTGDEEDIRVKYPLLGVPLTVKGSIAVAGLINTSGVVSRKNMVAEKDAVPVQRAREAGAIPLLVSNVPELCMNWETRNKLVGVTKNPHDTRRSAGGSSGGEASLLSSAASVIGIGSDVAGSLRLPSHFCGVFGHKPSPGAVSFEGHYPSCGNYERWKGVFTLGPMARYVCDLRLLLKNIVEDGYQEILRLDEKVNLDNIKIHYITNMKGKLVNQPSEDCTKAIEQVITHFKKRSKKVNPNILKQATTLSSVCLLGIDQVENLFDENYTKSYGELFKFITFRSDCELTAILYGVVKHWHGKLPKSLVDECDKKIEMLRDEFLKILGNDGVFIMPSYFMEAQPHGDFLRRAFNHSYLSIFNSLGFPVTCCPVSFSQNNLPIGIQIVATPNNDRLTLAVAEEIEKVFGGWRPPNNTQII